jgi:hypothetical protein
MGDRDPISAMVPRDRAVDAVAGCRSYLVASAVGSAADPADPPAWLAGGGTFRVDPCRAGSVRFLDRLQALNRLVHGASGLDMPRWVFYDCGEVPGGIVGLARPARLLTADVRRALDDAAGDDDLVPVTMIVAIPMLRAGWWQLYGLGSVDPTGPGAIIADRNAATVALALATLRIETALAAPPWRSAALASLARFAPLRLLTAWTPAHTEPRTATVRLPPTDATVPPAPDGGAADAGDAAWLAVDDDEALRALQHRLESGERLEIAGPPREDGAGLRFPVREAAP